jgi:nitrate reductase gamma subunit
MSAMALLLWVIVPYVCLAIFVVGHYWRYKYDKFGWTTRSSQLYERRLLRWGSPLFHFGILFALGGHVIGLGIPESWTSAVGLSETGYHVIAISIGAVAGVATLAGLVILIYRRRTVGPVFSATTRNDKIMYVLLTVTILAGLSNTLLGNVIGQSANYRATVSPWFRSIFYFHPQPELMAHAGLGYQVHAISACLLFAFWPFSRLVHVFSAPVGYLTRPYIVYRSRTPRLGTEPERRGWEKVGSGDNLRR